MTYPWAAGEVLTAADLNAYAGLVHINTTTIGAGVASVTVSNVFSAQFYNYRIVLSSMDASTAVIIQFTFVSQSGNFYGNRLELNNTTTTVTNVNTGVSGVAYAEIGRTSTSNQGFATFDVYSPNFARRKGVTGNYYGAGYNGTCGYEQNVTNAYTGFVLTPSTGTLDGGNIYVYGYNNG